MSFSDLTPENTITDASGNVIGVSGSPLYVTGSETTPVFTQLPSNHYDAFGRQRVSEQTTLLDFTGAYPEDLVRYVSKKETAGGTIGAASGNDPSIKLSVTTASGDFAGIQTRRSIEYNKGNSQQIFITGRFATGEANLVQRLGYFRDTHGCFFQYNGTTMQVCVRTKVSGSVVNNTIDQTSWNVDTLSGQDWTKQNIFMMDFGWLGSHIVRFYCGNASDAKLTLVHQEIYSGAESVPFMDSGMAPVCAEIETTGTISGAASMYATCMAVKSEGSPLLTGTIRVVDTGTTTVSAGTSETVAAGIRLKSSYINGSIKPVSFQISPTSGNAYLYYKVIYNPTLTSPTWSDLTGIAQGLTGTMPTYTGGSVLDSGYIELTSKGNSSVSFGGSGVTSDVYLGADYDRANADALILTFQTTSGSSNVLFTGSYREFI